MIMNKFDIINLARKYAEDKCNGNSDTERVIEDFLGWLTETHCIVTKEWIISLYECYTQHESASLKNQLHDATLIARGSMVTLRDCFGTEVFNPSLLNR